VVSSIVLNTAAVLPLAPHISLPAGDVVLLEEGAGHLHLHLVPGAEEGGEGASCCCARLLLLLEQELLLEEKLLLSFFLQANRFQALLLQPDRLQALFLQADRFKPLLFKSDRLKSLLLKTKCFKPLLLCQLSGRLLSGKRLGDESDDPRSQDGEDLGDQGALAA